MLETITAPQPMKLREPPTSLVICAGDKIALQFSRDGTVYSDPTLDANEAAKAVIAAIKANWNQNA